MESVVKMKPFILGFLLMHGVSGFDVIMSVMEGDSVTLHTHVKTNQQVRIRWYFNDTRVAQIIGDQSRTCTDVQCKERFRDRLKLDHQTGSLTITDTRTTDSGDYHQETVISGNISEKIFRVTITGRPGSEAVQMITNMEEMKGGPYTLDNGEAKTSGTDGEDEVGVLSAIKSSTLNKGSDDSKVIVGVIVPLLAVSAILISLKIWKSKRTRNEPKCKNREKAILTEVLTPNEKIPSSENSDCKLSVIKSGET